MFKHCEFEKQECLGFHVNSSKCDEKWRRREHSPASSSRSMSLEAMVHILQDFDSAQIAVREGFHNILLKLSLRPVEFQGFVSSRIMLDRRHDLMLRLVDVEYGICTSY